MSQQVAADRPTGSGKRGLTINLKRVLVKHERKRANEAELEVISALLGGTREGRLLLEQVRSSRALRRKVEADTFALLLPETTEDLLVDIDEQIIGGWQEVEFARPLSGHLEMRVLIDQSGIFNRLEARLINGSHWPTQWTITRRSLVQLDPVRFEANHLQPDSGELRAWAGVDEVFGEVRLHPPAGRADLDRLEKEAGAMLPVRYLEFLRITDGITYRGGGDTTWLAGTEDLYIVELDAENWWVISACADNHLVCWAEREDSQIRLWPHNAVSQKESEAVADDARDLVRRVLQGASLI